MSDLTLLLLDQVLKNLSEGVLFLDLEGFFRIVNEAAFKLIAFKTQTPIGGRFWDLLPDDFFGFSMREALKFGISHKTLYKTIGLKECEISTSFIYEGPPLHHGMILHLRDLSEKQKLLKTIGQTERMRTLGENVALIAHEARNALGGIRGFASLLCRDLQREKHLQEMAQAIVDGSKSLEQLVTSVLHYARPVPLQLESLDLVAFLKYLGKVLKADAAFSPRIRLELHIPDAPLLIPFDKEGLKGALLNLMFNAIQAMPEGGTLTLSLLKQESFCQIAISDTGVGMDEEVQKQLFSPFFTTKQKGTGLGLIEVEKIIQAHLGKIEVRSARGKGTTFTLKLPLRR